MNVTNQHQEYIEMYSEWTKATDFAHSEKRVHDKGEVYFPRLSGQEDDEYKSYVGRASLTMFEKKIRDTYRGMATRKPVDIENDEQLADYLTKVTPTDDSFDSYIFNMLGEYFLTGRCGTLVDLPLGYTDANPYLVLYNATSIINWNTDDYGILTMVVLREITEIDDGDQFNTSTEFRYRVLDLVDGAYRQRLFNSSGVQLNEDIFPQMNGKSLNYIPFTIHGGVKVKPPFLTEVLDLNLHHYQLSGDLGHGLHWVALPSPVLTGVPKEDVPNHIGSARFIVLEDSDAKAFFLEFEGKGLDEITGRMRVIEETISVMAINMIMNDNAKTATQANIDSSSTTASLAGVINKLSDEFTIVLTTVSDWMGKTVGNVSINTDFVSAKLDANNFNALVNAYIKGTISYSTFWKNLQHGEIASNNKTADEEQSEIETTDPIGMVE